MHLYLLTAGLAGAFSEYLTTTTGPNTHRMLELLPSTPCGEQSLGSWLPGVHVLHCLETLPLNSVMCSPKAPESPRPTHNQVLPGAFLNETYFTYFIGSVSYHSTRNLHSRSWNTKQANMPLGSLSSCRPRV